MTKILKEGVFNDNFRLMVESPGLLIQEKLLVTFVKLNLISLVTIGYINKDETLLTVNMTSTYHRLGMCRVALISILSQSILPDKVNLWVSREGYLSDIGIADDEILTDLIESLPKENVEIINICWVDNIGPYRKLIPILRESDLDDLIVTADDDIYYDRDWLNGLLLGYQKNAGKPVAIRAKAKKTNFLGITTSYIYWDLIKNKSASRNSFVVTFGGGAVLSKSMFRSKDIEDDTFLKIAPTTDDLWFSKLLENNNNKVVLLPHLLGKLYFIKHNDGLINENIPSSQSFLNKLRRKVLIQPAGFFGFPVCENDYSYLKINRYFDN